jgi:DNA mismatch endonuclease (patch repair protein)
VTCSPSPHLSIRCATPSPSKRMADVHTKAQRRFNMSRIRGKNTKPELVLRRALHRAGFRYRLHVKDLPGKPDLVFPSRRAVIFVHGCYWHRHSCRFGKVRAKTNAEFWETKLHGNVLRDRRHRAAIQKLGWRVLVVWECELRSDSPVYDRIAQFLLAAG